MACLKFHLSILTFFSAKSHFDFLNTIKLEAEDVDDDLDIDIGTITAMPDCRPESPDLNSVLGCVDGK